MASSDQMAPKEGLRKIAQTTDIYINSTSVGALNNQKQMQNKRFADIELKE